MKSNCYLRQTMFTGIIEGQGILQSIHEEGENKHLIFQCPFTTELKVDQSLSHNGVCLTVTKILGNNYDVIAVEETLKRTNLGLLKVNDIVNLERCMPATGRFDGHIVQGHIDQTAVCKKIEDRDGSWLFAFDYDAKPGNITVEKGSITVNGVSLTVVDSVKGSFSVAVIPYTFQHTNFHLLKTGDLVNIEFDILGKYIKAYLREK